MPDWTYQTIFRPLLFKQGPDGGRDLALGTLGRLSRLPLGSRLIQFMGHMRPDPRLAFDREKLHLQSRVGLGALFDSRLIATAALSEFGFGYLEIGPIVTTSPPSSGRIDLEENLQAVKFHPPHRTISATQALHQLRRLQHPFKIPLFLRLEPSTLTECAELLSQFSYLATGFIIPADRIRHLPDSHIPNLFIAVNPATWNDQDFQHRIHSLITSRQAQGLIVEPDHNSSGEFHLGSAQLQPALELLQKIRTSIGPDPILIGSAGIHSPADALQTLQAGADLVQIDSGLVFAGPGLPKRINEALLYLHERTHASPPATTRPTTEAWFWGFLMGLSMFVGGLLALLIASTRVLLPYDEAISGFNRETLAAINNRLLSFMTHDRVTLAGTMLGVGIIYLALSWSGIRRGVHWAWVTVIVSAFCGFLTFFSFLGFGYFDPFHAFVTTILFQFLLLTMHSHLPYRHNLEMPELWNDRRWKLHQWGQLMFVIHGAVLIAAGLIISCVGMTTIFVREDLEFMNTTFEALCGPNPTLLPLVAHDRATFGGMLISCGAATLLSALWGFGHGRIWLWKGLLLAGTVAYSTAILVHWAVGYNSLKHLLPAYLGLIWLWLSALFSYKFMAAPDPTLETAWHHYLTHAGNRTRTSREVSV